MQLQRLLCSTNTHVASVLECTLIANATAYAADGEPNASKTFCPETSAPSCPPLVRAVPPLQLLPSHGYNLMPDLWCLVLSPAVHGRADSNLALNSSNPVKMRFLWRCRMHHKFCHCKLILKFFYADCDHVLTNMVFSFFSFVSTLSLPHVYDVIQVTKCSNDLQAGTQYTQSYLIVFSYFPGHIFRTHLV